MEFRPATIKDLPAILRLEEKLNRNIRRYDATMNSAWPRSAAHRRYVRKSITSRNCHVWVAEHNGTIVGLSRSEIYLAPSYRTTMKIAEGHALYVEPEYRRKKIGQRLIVEFFRWAKKKGARRVRGLTDAGNTQALRLYHRLGWNPTFIILEADLRKLKI